MKLYDPNAVGLDNMELAVRTRAVLVHAGCETLADILFCGRRRMATLPGCGPAVLNNVEQVCATFGYRF